MNHEICDNCETVKHCSQHGCVPLQPLKPCRSPYCECTPGTCSHPGCYDARSEPFKHPAPVQEPDDSLLLCASDLEQSATYDNHVEMQACIRAVASRIKSFTAPPAAPVQEPVAILKGIDEYGPVVGWYKHWVTVPIGTKFYTTLPAAAVQEPMPQEQIADPCPGCTPGHVCRTPACGRLQLPQSHPLRNKQ
jgi:hypothetical protein